MNYAVGLETSAERDLKRLSQDMLRRVDVVLRGLVTNPRPRGVRKLEGREGRGWRVRVGRYRVLFTIDDEAHVVSVYRIRPRPTAYR